MTLHRVDTEVLPLHGNENAFPCKVAKKRKPLFCPPAFFVFFFSLCGFVLILYLWHSTFQTDHIGVVKHRTSTGEIYVVSNASPTAQYFGKIGQGIDNWFVKRRGIENGREYSWVFNNDIKLQVRKLGQLNCTSFQWDYTNVRVKKYPVDCFSLTNTDWYGGSELHEQIWPLQGVSLGFTPYYPQDMELVSNGVGPVLGRYWVTSNGSALLVNQTSPLVVSYNIAMVGHMCLSIDPTKYPSSVPAILEYKICHAANVKAIHQTMLQNFFKKPEKAPDMRMFQQPVWSTWVKYGKGVNQVDVEDFLQQITSHNFKCSQIEIDDMYSTSYGDFDFSPQKFPDPKAMIEKVHKAGCRVTVWVYPFANLVSKAFKEGFEKRYFVMGSDGVTPGLIYWWNGIASAIDFTNPAAYNWYLTRLQEFQKEYNIDSFKFDGGSVSYLPYHYQLNNSKAMPSDYSVAYATLASKINGLVEVRVADNSQNLPVFLRFLDRAASWSPILGLPSVVPTVLTMGILGYPFILPDMIGGNGEPDKELFVRWLQLNIFLPSMQFSHVPWDFDNDTVSHAQELMAIRQKLNTTFIDCIAHAVKTGEPIIRPLWWAAPEDPLTWKISQQFMLGDEYLVAPVVQQKATTISIYLPKGIWQEQFGNMFVHNVITSSYIQYPATLYDVFYFKNITSNY